MSDNESLESKYGRKKTTLTQNDDNTQQETKNNFGFSNKYGNFTNKYKDEKKQQEQKNIKRNIAETLSEYNTNKAKKEHTDFDSYQKFQAEDATTKNKKETPFVKFLKVVVIILIILVIVCTVIGFIMRDKVNIEGTEIIDQINNAEEMYYSIYKKYYYFSKTSYDSTLGIDMSIYNFFSYYEVIHNDETGNYEVKLYGATNAFTITYHTIKAYINKRL